MKQVSQSLMILGTVDTVDPDNSRFSVRCKNGDLFDVFVGPMTTFDVMRNLDDIPTDRVLGDPCENAPQRIRKYVATGWLIAVTGVLQTYGDERRFDGRIVWLLASVKDQFLFEETHWWLTQTERLADQWLDSLFGDRRSYELDDFVRLYRTNLNIVGLPVDDDIQECAVLSRLIYGFSAAFLVTGQLRYRLAATAGTAFLRDSFRTVSHDGTYCFWAYGRRKTKEGAQLLVASEGDDDKGSIPLYEQIYALAGLTHYYRISLDPNVLEDIARTMRTFNDFFLDQVHPGAPDDPAFTGADGWFSHIDYVTMRPDRNQLEQNNVKKNWNSIGDHIPAYLVNLILMLDPLPQSDNNTMLRDLLNTARDMLRRSTELILDHFTDEDANIPYVNERFFADWRPDHEYSWQQNRAVIGHNFKIAWNLTRVANYCDMIRNQPATGADEKKKWEDLCKRSLAMADRLARDMTTFGIDLVRGGCYDTVERKPTNGQQIEFSWSNTKDFWQQEQAILAYLILYGRLGDQLFLDMARHTQAFWNLSFLDRPHKGIFFRVTDNGMPVTDPAYLIRGGHSDASGYHCFELAYLAHIYTRTYIAPQTGTDASMCLYFHPDETSGMRSINVAPDFVQPRRLAIRSVRVDGEPKQIADPYSFQVPLADEDLGRTVAVEFAATRPE